MASLALTTPLNLPAPGRRHPYTSTCVLAESCVFGKQSLGPFYCGSSLNEHSFSRSYGVILQSSLAIVLSLTLGFSPHPCVSIFGTGYCMIITRSFSWKLASRTSVLAAAFHTPHAFAFRQPDLPGCRLPRLHLHFHQQDPLAFSVTPSFIP